LGTPIIALKWLKLDT